MEEDLYSIHPSIPRSSDCDSSKSTLSDSLKAQITAHPRYPSLLSAYIDCRKVGAPPELAAQLEEIARENHSSDPQMEAGRDPELDEFMEAYCEVLAKYREELSGPFDEATSFLSRIEMQFTDLCRSSTSAADSPTEAGGSSEGEASECWIGSSRLEDKELKEMLLQKYSGYLSSLRKEFLKKRKKGKHPKDSRLALLDWWNAHCAWPYPTEEEKARLAETTGLDQKQINNWFINQRKRHWRPSEDLQIVLMESLNSGGASEAQNTGTVGP